MSFQNNQAEWISKADHLLWEYLDLLVAVEMQPGNGWLLDNANKNVGTIQDLLGLDENYFKDKVYEMALNILGTGEMKARGIEVKPEDDDE